MNRNNAGVVFALCLLAAGNAGADDDQNTRSCIADWTTQCSRECATARCVSNCTTQAHDQCKKDLTASQHSFIGPVTGVVSDSCQGAPSPQQTQACTPFNNTDSLASQAAASCTTVRGTVANPALRGGKVTIWVICPSGKPDNREQGPTATPVGSAQSNCDGTFTVVSSNACSGVTGCYGLISVDDPSGDQCAVCGNCPGPTATPGDPTWDRCTSTTCPTP